MHSITDPQQIAAAVRKLCEQLGVEDQRKLMDANTYAVTMWNCTMLESALEPRKPPHYTGFILAPASARQMSLGSWLSEVKPNEGWEMLFHHCAMALHELGIIVQLMQ